jgi:hypothetical protein
VNARRYIDGATSYDPQEMDQAVLASLAQAEGLLAVAAAISELSRTLREIDTSGGGIGR